MYQIAVCDDEKSELIKTQALLNIYQSEHSQYNLKVKGFTSINELLFHTVEDKGFDLLFLDIYMPEKNGIEGAKVLRDKGFEGDIVFLTSSREHAVDAYGVEAIQYLVKPVKQCRLFSILDKAIIKAEENKRRYVAIKSEGMVRRIPVRDIVFTESQNQYQCLYLINEKPIRVRMTVSALYDLVKEFSDFVRVGSTYIANLSYVDSLNAKMMNLTTGKQIWLPRGSYTMLKEQYFKFYRER